MIGILIALVVLAAIVAAVFHVSAGIALIVVIVAVVIAAIVRARNPNATMKTGRTGLVFSNICPACKKHNKSGAKLCRHCGTALVAKPPAPVEETKKCPDCAETVKADARKCRYCGHEFSSAAAPST